MLAFVGDHDPDFADPDAERQWIASLGAETVLVPDAGHYTQAQRPDITVPGTVTFVESLRRRGDGTTGASANDTAQGSAQAASNGASVLEAWARA